MFCNSSATLYQYDKTNNSWSSTFFSRVYWYDSVSAVAEDRGLVLKQNSKIYIPYSGAVAPVINIGKDFIVQGQGPEIDNTSEATISASLKAIADQSPKGVVPTIKGYSPCLYGSKHMHHLELVVY